MTRSFPFLFFLFLLLLAGCAEKPRTVGAGLTNDDGAFLFADTVLTNGADTSYVARFKTGLGLTNLVGRLSPAEEIFSLINFTPDHQLDSLAGARIDSVELRLIVNYRYPGTTVPFTVNAYHITTTWSQNTIMSDSAGSVGIGAQIGTASDSANYASTFIIQIDTAEGRKWATAFWDTTAPRYPGIALKAGPGNPGIVGFTSYSATYGPLLFIRYTKYGRRDSLYYSGGDDAFLPNYTVTGPLNKLMLRGGFGVRSMIRYDLGFLTKNTVVEGATLELTLDTAATTFSGFSPDTLSAMMVNSVTDLDVVDSTMVTIFGYRSAADSTSEPVYSFNVRTWGDLWARGVNKNQGISLRWSSEYSTAEKVVFHSSADPVASKRPKLKVIYAKK